MSAPPVSLLVARIAERASELPAARVFPCGACGNAVEVDSYGIAAWMVMSEIDRRQSGQGLTRQDCVRCAPCYRVHREQLYADIPAALFELHEVCRMLRQGRQPTPERMAAALAGPFSQSVQVTIDGLKTKGGGDDLR